MSAIHFTTVIGPDGVIHPPAGVMLPAGTVEVSVRPGATPPAEPAAGPPTPTYAWLLALAEDAEADPACQNLPPDMAENHDHYAHGAPKR
jgi:hypothetical protein